MMAAIAALVAALTLSGPSTAAPGSAVHYHGTVAITATAPADALHIRLDLSPDRSTRWDAVAVAGEEVDIDEDAVLPGAGYFSVTLSVWDDRGAWGEVVLTTRIVQPAAAVPSFYAAGAIPASPYPAAACPSNGNPCPPPRTPRADAPVEAVSW